MSCRRRPTAIFQIIALSQYGQSVNPRFAVQLAALRAFFERCREVEHEGAGLSLRSSLYCLSSKQKCWKRTVLLARQDRPYYYLIVRSTTKLCLMFSTWKLYLYSEELVFIGALYSKYLLIERATKVCLDLLPRDRRTTYPEFHAIVEL